MSPLPPRLAADLANGVYGVREESDVRQAFINRQAGRALSYLDVDAANISTGRTGGRFFNRETPFALTAPLTGNRAGEWVVCVRGTATRHDWLTDLTGALDRGPTGHGVHAGFARTFNSVTQSIHEALRGANPSTIHVTGHSLGGAVANLVAADLDQGRVANIQLYTFGAPRVGFSDFSSYLTQRLGADHIHRVYNVSDVIPMVPLFPFWHAPSDEGGYRISDTGWALSIPAHFMTRYTPAVEDHSWSSLASLTPGVESRLSVDYWIGIAKDNVSFPGSSLAFYALGKAIGALMNFIKATLGFAMLGAATLLDQLAAFLHRAATMSVEVSERLVSILAIAMKFAGRAMESGANLTMSFVSWVLRMLMQPIVAIASGALSAFDS